MHLRDAELRRRRTHAARAQDCANIPLRACRSATIFGGTKRVHALSLSIWSGPCSRFPGAVTLEAGRARPRQRQCCVTGTRWAAPARSLLRAT
ncbi:hypothetical protein CDO19_16570 [Xanthomonas oryzae pv. oryzae]|nr:hypothetical protein CDO19_16570 [Xanthomonas oryzae pv. oryzae]